MLSIIVWTIGDMLCVAILAVIAVVLLAHYSVEKMFDATRRVFDFLKKCKKKGE